MMTARNLWLLFLPLVASISLLLRDLPELVDAKNFSNVNNQSAINNFFSLEEIMSRLYVVDKNRLVINALTEKYLSQLVNNKDFYSDDILLQKTFPTSSGKKLLQLISCFMAYKHEEQRISKPYIPSKTNQVIDYRNLQKRFFGDISQSLFVEYDNFYQSAQTSGMHLVVPSQDDVSIPAACIRIHDLE